MHLRLATATLLFSAISFRVTAAPDVKINHSQIGEQVTISIQTKDLLDATVGIKVSGKNIDVVPSTPYFVDTRGQTNLPAVMVSAQDKRQPWSYSCKYVWGPGGRFAAPDSYEYAPPFEPNSSHPILQGYLGTFSHRECTDDQYALDWAAPVGTAVCAAREGVVVAVVTQWSEGGVNEQLRKKANYITIRHGDGTYGEYVHLKQNGASVKVGDKVRTGQPIGFSGNTGYSSRPHVHFCVYQTQINGFDIRKETLPVMVRGVEAKFISPRAKCSSGDAETKQLRR